MPDDQRSLASQSLQSLRQPAVWVVAVVSIALGVLLGWILFGAPHRISTIFKDDGLLEWVTAGATALIGFGAWKYARATHFHTLDRADEERSYYLLRRIEALSLMTFKLLTAKGGQSSWRSIEQFRARRPLSQGVARSSIEAARVEFGLISWADGETVAFNLDARGKFADLLRYCESAVRTCQVVVSALEDSEDVVRATQEPLLQAFQAVSDQTAEISDELIALVRQQIVQLTDERTEIEKRRAGRSRVFNFEP